MVVQESLGTRLVDLLTGMSYERRAILGTRATQPTLPNVPTSTTTVVYVVLYLHREKELASTSFGFMKALSRHLAVSAVSLLQVHEDVSALRG